VFAFAKAKNRDLSTTIEVIDVKKEEKIADYKYRTLTSYCLTMCMINKYR